MTHDAPRLLKNMQTSRPAIHSAPPSGEISKLPEINVKNVAALMEKRLVQTLGTLRNFEFITVSYAACTTVVLKFYSKCATWSTCTTDAQSEKPLWVVFNGKDQTRHPLVFGQKRKSPTWTTSHFPTKKVWIKKRILITTITHQIQTQREEKKTDFLEHFNV